jgi:hypothetical protein
MLCLIVIAEDDLYLVFNNKLSFSCYIYAVFYYDVVPLDINLYNFN